MHLAAPVPASDVARAQLILALLILALLPLFLTTVPAVAHRLRFDFGPIPEPLVPGMAVEPSGWIRSSILPWPSNRAVVSKSSSLPPAPPAPSAPRHRLDLLPDGRPFFDSRPIDPGGLQSRLGGLAATSGWIDFHPHPDARFEDVVETLAPVAYSGFGRLRIDNSRYSEAFEAAMAGYERPGRHGRSRSPEKGTASPRD